MMTTNVASKRTRADIPMPAPALALSDVLKTGGGDAP
jgi:hypothetical protein